MTASAPPRLRTLASIAALVAAGYYLGVQVGLLLRFPPATTSILWPPNAILTASLLLTPVRFWWICLAGALPVHFLVQMPTGWGLSFIASIFATNCSEAVLAAGGMRLLSDAPLRFDTLRRVGAFVVAAGITAPVLSSFADAAAVHAFQGEPYWTVWRTRVFANSLTELSVVPLIVLVATAGSSCVVELSRKRIAEALLLGATLTIVGLLVLGSGAVMFGVPGVPRTPTVFLLPLFFWSAVRFGAGGMSTALFVSALIASFMAIRGSRPFDVLEPPESLLALQMYLVLMAIPLFAVAALLDERRRAMADLGERLRFEALLSTVSGSFVRVPGDQLPAAFETCLQRVGQFVGVDRVAIMQISACGQHLQILQQWTAPAVERLPATYSCDAFPWVLARLFAGEDVVCGSMDDLPPHASRDRDAFQEMGLRSALVIPLVSSGSVHGVVSLHMVRSPHAWPRETVAQMHLVAEVLAHALARKRTDDALRSSESMKTAILSSLSSLVAVLDREGTVIAVNESRVPMAAAPAADRSAQMAVGTNYFDVFRQVNGDGTSAAALQGLEAVLANRSLAFEFEYSVPVDGQEHWVAMSVVPLQRAEGGAVVTHVDVTERRRAELEAQRARQELAHFSRVSTMGELTASLAHQLNQPLTGILSNAQAARRFLDASPPDVQEIRDIVGDIIEDDRRAGEVIRRMRDMMTKVSSEMVALDVNALIRDVAVLMASDTIIRNVPFVFELAPEAPFVRGDRVELQQVVLNLLMNAMDAVEDRPVAERGVIVRSECRNGSVLVSVKDSGWGLAPGAEANVFEPFFTTKATGMGMGLAIARSIVESHGGHIWAESNAHRGATFFVSLPLAHETVM
jgi:signal transduction histidine kinase/integral membrane sensor domain MASE1